MRQWMMAFGVGLALGIAGTLALPALLGPYLPESWRPAQSLIVGEVIQKVEQEAQVRLVVETEWGALLATFTDAWADRVRLLVDEGDEIAFALRRYQPFVDNPEVARVLKGGAGEHPPAAGGQPG